MNVEILPRSEALRWREFVAAHPAGDVLQCMEWGDLKSRTGWTPTTLAVTEGDRIVAGAMALKRMAPMGRSILYCPRGPVVDLADSEALGCLIEGLRKLARDEKAILIKIDPPVVGDEAAETLRAIGFCPAPIEEKGFGGTQPRAVMKTLPLGDDEGLLARFKSKWRYNIRLADRKGVVINGDTTPDDLRDFYSILKETGERDGFHVRDFAYYEDIYRCIIEPGLGRLFMASLGDQPLSGAIDFILGRQCWYVYGASSNEHRNLMPNHLLQWRMMQWARDEGCQVYDFRGVPLDRPGNDAGLEGLVRFKAGFDARYVEYVGEWDLPLSSLLYGAFTRLEPLIRRVRLRLRG